MCGLGICLGAIPVDRDVGFCPFYLVSTVAGDCTISGVKRASVNRFDLLQMVLGTSNEATARGVFGPAVHFLDTWLAAHD